MVSPYRPKVLVVEDDAQLAHLYCTALALKGVAPIRVGDGNSAFRALEQQRPDMVLLDLMLPVVDGRTVLQQFAKNPLTSDIPIIVVTGVDPTPQLPHALRVLPKPCDPDHVAEVVSDHLFKRNR
jgi:CheY-like chemotaxis protein